MSNYQVATGTTITQLEIQCNSLVTAGYVAAGGLVILQIEKGEGVHKSVAIVYHQAMIKHP